MIMMGKSILSLAAVSAAFLFLAGSLTGCEPEDKAEDKPSLFRVLIHDSVVELDPGGSSETVFSVQDPDYIFNFDVNSPGCEVFLMGPSGKRPENYRLSFVKMISEGRYSAVIEDLGKERGYSDDVHLAVRVRGQSSYILSPSFLLKSTYVLTDNDYHTGIPVVKIVTKNSAPVVSKDVYVDGTMSIDGLDRYPDTENTVCHIKGRGNSTWGWPKKPYAVKLDEKTSILGMPKHKRWVLLANFVDRTMMRNIVSMHLGQMTSLAWTPHCVPVELVLNGKHMGNYLLIEQVRVDKNRVNVDEENGFMLESDFHFDNKWQWTSPYGYCWTMGNCIPYGIKYPDEDEISSEQIEYAKQYVEQFSSVLYGEDFKDPVNGYARYMDVRSFIDYWIVFEMMGNHELSNPGSVYTHFERGGKISAGPLWDFDWGVLSYKTSPQAKAGFINKNAIWYARLFQDPAFVESVQKRWNELLPQLRTIPDYMSDTEKLLEKSAELNFRMWNPSDDASQNGGDIINGDERLSYSEACAKLRSVFTERLQLLDKLIKNL